MSEPPDSRERGSFDRPAVWILFLVGLWVLFAPPFLGWENAERRDTLLRVMTAFLLFFAAGGILDRRRLRKRIDDLYEAVNMLLYGKTYQGDREAVRILIRSLGSEDERIRKEAWEHLKRLTGQNFALDQEVWQSWWNVNEKRFARKSKRPEEE